jgi:DNA-binding transcriptional ArsR family regulator
MRTLKTKADLSKNEVSIDKIEGSCERVAAILKELSHPQRLLILGHLLAGPKTVTELIESCRVSQSQMSHFLMRMRFAGLVEAEKKGKFQYYSLSDQRLVQLMKTIQTEYCNN